MNRNLWIDYLRSFLTLLVVAHHSSLAYTTFAYFDTSAYINSTSPIVDNSRWIGLDIFENFNDIFFMSLMFLISGLFVFKGFTKKGNEKFLTERFKRLGIPFAVAVTCIIPIAYLPSFFLINHTFNIRFFVTDYVIHQQWPVGPPWFIWLLLLFNIVAVVIPAGFYTAVSNSVARLVQKPFLLILIAYAIVSLAFIPISLWVGQYTWTGFGPFDFQLNRLLLYFVFFIFGTCIGSGDWEGYLFKNNRFLNTSWHFWAVLSFACYLTVELFTFYGLNAIAGKLTLSFAYFVFDLLFVASCISSSFAFLCFFKQKVSRPFGAWTNLSANAFGIYLIHYVFVTWLQFALSNTSLPAFIKFLIVFLGSVIASWGIINSIRKFQLVSQVI